MVNDQRCISLTIVCALNARHPKFYRMLALFHRKYISPSYRGGREIIPERRRLDSGLGMRSASLVEGLSGCPFSLFVSSVCDVGMSFGDSDPWAMIASFNTGALFWWITVERHARTGTPLISFLIGLCISFQFNRREAYAWDLTSDWIRKGSFELI